MMQRARFTVLTVGAALCAATLSACSFDPSGANYVEPTDASAPADDDADLADAHLSPDASPIDADEPDAEPVPPPADAAPDGSTPLGCGDGVVTPPEQCDDHGTAAGDGCSPACRWEPGACYPGAQMVALVPGATQSGSTTGQTSGLAGGGTCGGSTSGEDVFTFELSEPADVTVTTALPGTVFNTALYVRSDCNDVAAQLGCASQAAQGDTLALPALPVGSYFAIVDGFAGAAGDYQIRLTVRAIRDLGETCDPFGEASRCADGLSCQAMGTTGNAVCVDAGAMCPGAPNVTLGGAGSAVQHGATAGASGYAPRCAPSGSGPENLLRTVVPDGGARDLVLDVTSTSALNPVAEIITQCGVATSSLSCSAAASGGGSSELAVVTNVAPGTYFAVIDGFNGTSGAYDADFYLRPVLAAGASCDRHVRDNRCGSGVCVDGNTDLDVTPTCTTGVPVQTEGADNSSCDVADGPRNSDFVYEGQIGAGDVDVVALRPSPVTTRIVASVYGPGGTCPVDLALSLTTGDCAQPDLIVASNDEGIGSCPYIDASMQPGGGQAYWLTVTRAATFGTGTYTIVVDFIP